MLTTQQHISQNLGLIDQAAREGRACRVTLHNGIPVVETSPKEFLKKNQWKFSHRRNKAAEKKLKEMIIEVIGKPDTSLSLKKQIVEGAKARRYPFFSDREAKAIVRNEALLLRPVQIKAPVPKKTLPKRKIKLIDAMKSNGPVKRVPSSSKRHRFPDALKNSGPAKVIQKKQPQEKPPIPFTPPTIVVRPPTEEAVKLDSSRLVDFETTPLFPTAFEPQTPPSTSSGIPYIPTSVDVPENPVHTSTFQVSGPITLIPLEQLERPVIFPKAQAEMLEETRKDLETKQPNINLGDTDKFLWLYYTCEFLEKGTSDESDELKTKLENNFAAAGLSAHYKRLQTEKMWEAVRLLKIDMPPEAFTECLDEMSEISTPQRFQMTQQLVRDIHENSFRKVPSPNGDPAKRVDAIQLEFLEEVKETDELMEELGFEIFDPDESDEPLQARSRQFDVSACLKDELLSYSTEHESFAQLVDQLKEFDPSEIRTKVREGAILTREELNAIVAAKKQKLEVTQTLGRKWGDSLLLDGRNWPDAESRNTLSKLYDLASLDSPAISASLTTWVINKQAEAEYHPQVVIEGSSFQGLLAALTQVEAGADVTLLLSSEPLFNPTETIRLDPQWIETLRFHLGGQFDLLFNYIPALQYEEKSSGLIHPDGFGEISAGTLHQALWSQVLDVAQHDSSPLKMVSNASVTDIEAPDQQDGKYLVQIEHQGAATVHKNKVPVDLLINARKVPNAASAEYLETVTPNNKTPKVVSHVQPKPIKRVACRCAFSLPQSPIITRPPGKSPFDVVVTDEPFRRALAKNMVDRLGHNAPPLPGVRDSIQSRIRLDLIERKEDFDSKNKYKIAKEMKTLYLSMKKAPAHLKTIHSESRDSLQLEMELPPPLCHYLQAAEAYLKHEEATPEEAETIRQQILAAWFETVAVQIQLPKRGIRPEHLRQDSLSTFSPEQTLLEPPVETLEANNSILTITAIGPAAVTNPMSPEANQSAAREHILHCQALTEKLSEHHTKDGHLKDTEDLLEDTGDLAHQYDLLRTFVTRDD
ncbi:MAG: hypothetical protein ACR2PX_08980 [Endozoicomonas sp.]|uniref:hypothetical protein n=1 Tax=Endozoicomonas sp. TaxID=1892382 RepID=UPI003D9AE6C6